MLVGFAWSLWEGKEGCMRKRKIIIDRTDGRPRDWIDLIKSRRSISQLHFYLRLTIVMEHRVSAYLIFHFIFHLLLLCHLYTRLCHRPNLHVCKGLTADVITGVAALTISLFVILIGANEGSAGNEGGRSGGWGPLAGGAISHSIR